MTPDQQDIDPALRRTVGIAALRRIRRLVDEDNALEQWRARWAVRIGAVFAGIAAAIALAWFIR
jgi:hypothetical protein